MTTASSHLARSWRRWVSLLLALTLGFSSVEIAWAEAFDTSEDSISCASDSNGDREASGCSVDEVPVTDADEDCPCLCACACPGAQHVTASAPTMVMAADLGLSCPTPELARAPRMVPPAPQFRPPVA